MIWIANLVAAITPQSRWFALRRMLYRIAGVRLSKEARINGTVRIHHPNATIGNSWVGPRADIIPTTQASVRIGDRCAIGPGVMFVTGTHEFGNDNRRAGPGYSLPISVGDGTWVGARCVFTAGSGTGTGCIVAAGAVVTTKLPDNVLAGGVPARVLRQLS